jgi:hypothetical protein
LVARPNSAGISEQAPPALPVQEEFMADQSFEFDVFRDLLEGASVIGQVSKDEKIFDTLYNAFRSADAKTFQSVLNQFGLLPRCRFICEWIRSKECIFLCLELCGPPRPIDKPDPRLLAETIVRLTAEPALVNQLVQILDKRDSAGFQRIVAQFNLGPICHLFCHWLCVVRYRLICRLVCSVQPIPLPDLAQELISAGQTLRQLLAQPAAFDQAVAASNAGDSDKLGTVIRGVGIVQFCYLICEWFCSWRCVLACNLLCSQVPLVTTTSNELHEAFQFAGATAQLAQNATALEQLSVAVGAGDTATYNRLLVALKLQPFCIQLCHWICSLRCCRFCFLVCPPIFNHPWFTHVGDFGILADIDPGTGLTNKSQAGHGGPSFGFFGCLSLRGFCPKFDPAHPLEQMAYRFLFQPAGAPTATPITGGFVCEVLVGTRYALWNGNPFTLQSVRIRGTGATSPTPPVGPPGPNPPDHYIVPDPQGWVTVDANALDDGFNGWLMGFASAVPFPGGDPTPGLTAGSPVPLANQKNGSNSAIIFQATRVSTIVAVNGGAAPDYTNQLGKIHINNWPEVNLINLQEFIGPGSCSPLSTDLHILYTTDHELLADWFIDLVTAAVIMPAPVFPSGVGPRGAAGTDFHNITTWPQCSYLLRLHTRRSLTTGLLDDSDKWNFTTFCIGKK